MFRVSIRLPITLHRMKNSVDMVRMHFRVLGLKPTATWEEVQFAYDEICAAWDPERLRENRRLWSKAEHKLRDADLAYTYLREFVYGDDQSSWLRVASELRGEGLNLRDLFEPLLDSVGLSVQMISYFLWRTLVWALRGSIAYLIFLYGDAISYGPMNKDQQPVYSSEVAADQAALSSDGIRPRSTEP